MSKLTPQVEALIAGLTNPDRVDASREGLQSLDSRDGIHLLNSYLRCQRQVNLLACLTVIMWGNFIGCVEAFLHPPLSIQLNSTVLLLVSGFLAIGVAAYAKRLLNQKSVLWIASLELREAAAVDLRLANSRSFVNNVSSDAVEKLYWQSAIDSLLERPETLEGLSDDASNALNIRVRKLNQKSSLKNWESSFLSGMDRVAGKIA